MSLARRTFNPSHASPEQERLQSAQREVTRAEEDYRRLRTALLEIEQRESGHEVGLAMVGADVERAHARLQDLVGLHPLPSAGMEEALASQSNF